MRYTPRKSASAGVQRGSRCGRDGACQERTVAAMQVTHLPYAFFEGKIVPIEEAKVSIATHALQYGTGVFGGIRGYLDQDGSTINIFRLPDHFRRFTQSANLLKIGLPAGADGLCEIAVELTRRNRPT